MIPFRYLLLLAVILPGCAAPTSAPAPSAAGAQADLLNRTVQEQQQLSRQVADLEEQVRQLQVRLQAQQAAVAGLTGPATEMVTPDGQKTESGSFPPAPAPPATTDRTATDIYLKAFTDYASGRFNEAASGFRLFIERYPYNDFTGNAQFWLGECYYSQRLLSKALAEFSQIAERHPDSSKAPAALLRMAAIYGELNRPDEQQRAEQLLREMYPQSKAAAQLESAG